MDQLVVRPRATSALSREVCETIQTGILGYTYRGIKTYKCPFDLAIYSELLSDLRPRTIVEFGSNMGGSALWLADTLDALKLSDTRLYTLDIEFMHQYSDPRVRFVRCDIGDIRSHLSEEMISSWQRPLLFIDDASHQYRHSLNILKFFDEISKAGDYIIVEDGIISIMDAEGQYEGGPHRAIHEFLAGRGAEFVIDRKRCDYFGHNVTWNVDGYIRRVAPGTGGAT